MKINSQELKEALQVVKPGLASQALIEQSTSFAFMEDRIITYNDEISIQQTITPFGFSCAILASTFYSFVQKISTEEVDVSTDGNELLFKSGRAKAGFAIDEKIVLPFDAIPESTKWIKLPERFLKFIQMASESASTDLTYPVLSAVHITKSGNIEATDRFRLFRGTVGSMKMKDFLLPASVVQHIVRLKPTHMAFAIGDSNWVTFKNGTGAIISARIQFGEYVDVETVLEQEYEKIKFPKKLKGIINRSIAFTEDSNVVSKLAIVKLEDKEIKIKVETEVGWYEESAKVRYSGEPMQFQIRPSLLLAVLEDTLDGGLAGNMLQFVAEDWLYLTNVIPV